MATFITEVHMEGGSEHEHIARVRWKNSQTGESTKQQMVEFIEKGNSVKVEDGRNTVDVGVVNATPKYIRTYADGKWSNNLLALPRF